LTAGSGGTNYPSILAALTARTVYNGGIPSQTSVQIADRGSDPTNSTYDGWTTIFWLGYNDFGLPGGWQPNTVITNIERILAARAPSNYIVLSVVNASGDAFGTDHYRLITNINAGLAQKYGSNYFDIRAFLVSQYDSDNPQDVSDHDNDIPPSSLRVDGLHWNPAGQMVIASKLASLIGPPTPSGNVYYVSPTGTDGAAGTIGAPWRTIAYGVTHISTGDTLYLRGGSYNESFVVNVDGVTLSGYPGESAVIDGQTSIPTSPYWPLVYVKSDHVTLTNFSVINSWYAGIILGGLHSRATHLTVNSNMENAILVSGNYGVVDNCSAHWNARSHEFYTFNIPGRTTWAGGINVARCPGNATVTNNTVWNTWGEAISAYESTNNVFRGNISYDSQTCLYVSDTTDNLIEGNLFYCSPNNVVKTAMGSDNQPSVLFGDEQFVPASARNTFINNLVMGGDYCFYNTLAANSYVKVANNTFVNAFGLTANVQYNGHGIGSSFVNNIIVQDNGLACIYLYYSDWAAPANNLWSKASSTAATSATDIVANPQLAKTGLTGPGQLTPAWFRLLSGSPAIKAGVDVFGVSADFFGTKRGSPPDVGACSLDTRPPPPSNLQAAGF